MHPGIGEHVAFLAGVRFTAQGLGRFDEIVNAAGARRAEFVRLIWSMQWGIQLTISALTRSFQSGLFTLKFLV